jgi:hypothetical protein
MAKKVTPNPNRCGQCSLATFLEDNVTLTGEMFLLKCPHFKGGEVYHFAKDPACEHFKPRNRATTID